LGGEQFACRVVLIGSVAGAPSKLVVGRGMMDHQLDLAGARAAFAAAGLRMVDGALVAEDRDRIAAVFVNAGANYLPHTLGRRHTMNSDFLATWAGHQAKAVVLGQSSGERLRRQQCWH
jgi:cyanuric acid amidohydrolase